MNPKRDLKTTLKSLAASVLPRNSFPGSNVAQLFLNGGGIETEYTFTNIASLYSPKTGQPYVYTLTLHDGDGRRARSTVVTVPVHGTRALRLSDVMKGPLPDRGLLSVSLRSASALFYGDKHLGRVNPHFYALYRSVESGSYALIHPQAAIGATPVPAGEWRSTQLIDTARVRSLRIFQINPCLSPATTSLRLCGLDGEVLQESTATLPPLSSREVEWPLFDFTARPFVVVGMKGLPGPNSKPLVFNVFFDGSFSASHG